MLNLDGVIDDYLKDIEPIDEKIPSWDSSFNRDAALQAAILGSGAYYDPSPTKSVAGISYQFKNGVIKFDFSNSNQETVIPITGADEYYTSWGWFEDHILNSFFSIDINIRTGKGTQSQELQSVRSVSNGAKMENGEYKLKSNRCHTSNNLFTKGLGSVILPGNTHQSAFDTVENDRILEGPDKGKTRTTFKQKVTNAYNKRIFEIFDRYFKEFVPKGNTLASKINSTEFEDTDGFETFVDSEDTTGEIIFDSDIDYDAGIIRNMVFPIAKFKQHFTNMETLKQGLRSFWSDVENEYGSYWSFVIGQDQDDTGRVGIADLYYKPKSEKLDYFITDNQSTREDFINYKYKRYENDDKTLSIDKTEKMFKFPLYSKDSIVKDFNLNVKMSAKAATIATYGGNTNLATGTQRSGDLSDISLQAYSLLLNPTRKAKTSKELKNDLEILLENGVTTKMSFPIDDDMIGKGTDAKGYSPLLYTPQTTNENGIDFRDIKIKNPETNEILERMNEMDESLTTEDTLFYWYDEREKTSSRFYDGLGNMKSEYVSTMLHLINNSLYEGDESNQQSIKPVIPIDIDMTIDGVGGLRPFDLFMVDYLPEVYRNYTYFQIFDVGHTITPGGWETNITAKMKLDLPKYRKDNSYTIKPKRDFKSFAVEFRNKEQVEEALEKIGKLQKQINFQIPLIQRGKAILDIAQQQAALNNKELPDSYIVRFNRSEQSYTTERLNTNRQLSEEYTKAIESLGNTDAIYKVSEQNLESEKARLLDSEALVASFRKQQEELRNETRVRGTSVQDIIKESSEEEGGSSSGGGINFGSSKSEAYKDG